MLSKLLRLKNKHLLNKYFGTISKTFPGLFPALFLNTHFKIRVSHSKKSLKMRRQFGKRKKPAKIIKKAHEHYF